MKLFLLINIIKFISWKNFIFSRKFKLLVFKSYNPRPKLLFLIAALCFLVFGVLTSLNFQKKVSKVKMFYTYLWTTNQMTWKLMFVDNNYWHFQFWRSMYIEHDFFKQVLGTSREKQTKHTWRKVTSGCQDYRSEVMLCFLTETCLWKVKHWNMPG